MAGLYLFVSVLICIICNPLMVMAAQSCRQEIPASTPVARFNLNSDGTVYDSLTGLTWKRCSEGRSGESCEHGTAATFTWQGAQKAAASSNFAGKNNWRLPTIKELDTIVEYRCTMPAIDTVLFPVTPAANFWSASPYAGYENGVWNVNFNDGVRDNCSKNFQLYLRLVRDGK